MKLPALSKTYGGKLALALPPLELEDGLIHAVIGANGSGKSTLARILAGAIPPDGGAFRPDCEVGYMPQKSYAFRMSVLRNLRIAGGGREEALAMLERFGLGHLADRDARSLSGGETARMAMARLLMRDCPLLILDEPTAAMDVGAALLAEELLLEHRARTGCTVVLVTHSLTQARRLADRALFLKEGRLVEHGRAEEVLETPEKGETRAFLDYYRL